MIRRALQLSSNHAYWAVVFALLGCTMFFVGNVQWRRAQLRSSGDVEIESGFSVHAVRVIDADEIAVRGSAGGTFVVRMLGIKGFSPSANEPGVAGLGKAAVTSLEHEVEGKVLTVTFDEFQIDRSGAGAGLPRDGGAGSG